MAGNVKNYGITGVSSNVELGKGGSIISGSAADNIRLLDAEGNAIVTTVAEGTDSFHAVTKSQLDVIDANKLKYQTFTVAYDDGNIGLANATANTRIVSVVVEPEATWTGADNNTTITVGDDSEAARLLTGFDPEFQSSDEITHVYSSETTIKAFVSSGSASAGNAKITVWYTGALSAAPETEPPATSGYRYWRILFDGVAAGDRVSIAEIEFLDKRYYRRATGTFSASGETSSAVEAEYAVDGIYSRQTSSEFWQSNLGTSDIWYRLDAGEGNEFTCEGVTLARAGLTTTFTGFQVQYSSDDVNWATEWTVTDVSTYSSASTGNGFSTCGPPVTFTNPNIATFIPTAGFDTANVILWLKSYDGVFTGNYTGIAGDGDLVQTMTNHAAGFAGADVEIKQTLEANRPILRSGGAQGMPYLEFDNTSSQYFEDIPYVMPSGSTANYPGATGFLADVSDPNNTTSTVYPVLGNAGGTRKNILVFINNVSGNFFLRAHRSSGLDEFVNNADGLQSTVHAWSTYNRNQFINTNGGWVADIGTSTYATTAVSTAQLFRTGSGTSYMKGKVYEMILDLGTATGNTTTDAAKAQFQAYAIHQYLEGRRLYGVP